MTATYLPAMTRLLPALALPPLPLFALTGIALAQDDPLKLGGDGDDAPYVRLEPYVQVDTLVWDDTPDPFGTDEIDLNVGRLYVSGGAGAVSGLFAYEFTDGGFVKYALASYQVSDRLSITVGQQDEPFSLTDLPGGKALTFADSSEVAALVPGDNVGVTALYDGGTYSLAGGVFGGDFRTGVDEEGTAYSARATWNPSGRPEDEGVLIHLGAAANHRTGADFEAGFAQGVGAGLVPRNLVAIGSFDDVERITRANLEGAVQLGSVIVQSELAYADTERTGGRADTAYAGYLQASWLVTGERQPYDVSYFTEVVPDRPVPEGGVGALELALRLDAGDFGDQGEVRRATVAANWHLTKELRLGLNVSYTDTEDAGLPGDRFGLGFLRLQYAY